MEEEITALDKIMKQEEEEKEETSAQNTEAGEDTLAMINEDTAQGPQVMRGPSQATPWLGSSTLKNSTRQDTAPLEAFGLHPARKLENQPTYSPGKHQIGGTPGVRESVGPTTMTQLRETYISQEVEEYPPLTDSLCWKTHNVLGERTHTQEVKTPTMEEGHQIVQKDKKG